MATKADEKYMRRALKLAALSRGRTSPNPMVGAVIVKEGRIVAEGRHERAGAPHAEIEALNAAEGDEARGATAYVTLEPCSHQGRTPPCAPALVRARVDRVVVGTRDPNPLVSGRGIRILRDAGIDVETGVLERDCLRLNEAFNKHITTGLPFVIMKGAMTLDGKIASSTGDSKWITSEESRERVHRLRSEVDAVIVGSGTMMSDDPSLNCRLDNKIKDPYRVVMDSALRTPADSNFCKLAGDGKTIVITTTDAPGEKATRLESAGCRIIRVAPGGDARVDPASALKALGDMDITSVLVEGGGELHFSFLRAGLVDKALVFIAPILLGGRTGKTLIEGEGFPLITEAIALKDIEIERIGNDILIEAYLKKQTASH